MSREIKFRAWDKDLKKMHICGENQHDSINFTNPENEAYYYNLQNGCGSSSDGSGTYELMQFTGLKDKNGKEIYEGDILAINNTRYVVGYREYSGGWQLEIKNEYCAEMVQGNCDLLEVIGNIYENPELLEATA